METVFDAKTRVLTIKIEVPKVGADSSTGKMTMYASTGGFQPIDNSGGLKVNLMLGTMKPK